MNTIIINTADGSHRRGVGDATEGLARLASVIDASLLRPETVWADISLLAKVFLPPPLGFIVGRVARGDDEAPTLPARAVQATGVPRMEGSPLLRARATSMWRLDRATAAEKQEDSVN